MCINTHTIFSNSIPRFKDIWDNNADNESEWKSSRVYSTATRYGVYRISTAIIFLTVFCMYYSTFV